LTLTFLAATRLGETARAGWLLSKAILLSSSSSASCLACLIMSISSSRCLLMSSPSWRFLFALSSSSIASSLAALIAAISLSRACRISSALFLLSLRKPTQTSTRFCFSALGLGCSSPPCSTASLCLKMSLALLILARSVSFSCRSSSGRPTPLAFIMVIMFLRMAVLSGLLCAAASFLSFFFSSVCCIILIMWGGTAQRSSSSFMSPSEPFLLLFFLLLLFTV